MDQSGKGSRFRRVLPLALAGVGVYAVVAYGSSTFNGAPTHLVSQRVTPADQVISSADPLPASAPVQVPQTPVSATTGQVGSAGRDLLPNDAAAVTRSLNNAATSAVVPSSSKPAPAASANPASGLLGGVPAVGNLVGTTPAGGALNNLPAQNLTSSGLVPSSSIKNATGGLAGATLPQVNGLPLGGGLLP